MVKVELAFNPYLMETIVRFNGHEPKINSLVEKYQKGRLQDWITLLPGIFYDEMNGYDFELDFSGTEDDFERIKESFRLFGVSEDEVEFFFKNVIESPRKKNERIDLLLQWLRDNSNRRFDFEELISNNVELFENPYSYITLNGGAMDSVILTGIEVPIENINDATELVNTDLTNTPIVFCINDDDDNGCFRKNLRIIQTREDVTEQQLFFYISPSLNRRHIERIVRDLGIKSPQLVESVNDKIIEDYFELYPLTDYIKEVLDILRDKCKEIQGIIDEENTQSTIINSQVHERIDFLDDEIRRLKISDEKIIQRNNLDFPKEFEEAKSNAEKKIRDWRKKKTKTTNSEEAKRMATELEQELDIIIRTFKSEIATATKKRKDEIDIFYTGNYEEARIDERYRTYTAFNWVTPTYDVPSLVNDFMSLKTEQYVDLKADFLYFFNGGANEGEKVLETTYLYDSWRNKAIDIYIPIMQQIIEERMDALVEYYAKMADSYDSHIKNLIQHKAEEKDFVIAQLSDDEKMLQIDNDWLSVLQDMIGTIERG